VSFLVRNLKRVSRVAGYLCMDQNETKTSTSVTKFQLIDQLCASRPRHPYVSSLAARDGDFVQLDLDASGSAADNDATVRAFWVSAAGPLGLDARFVDEAVARAGGNVQHAVQLRRHVAATPAQLRRVEDIPRGLGALIERTWERIAHDTVVVEGLGILCAAREALTLDELGTVADWTADAPRRAFLRGAKESLVETQRPDGQREYRLHHDSIRAHMAQAIGDVALRGHHSALAERLATWPAPAQAVARRYALRHALIHRAEAGDWADAWRIAGDTSFLEAKCRELGGAHDIEADVTRVAERSRAGGIAAIGDRFSDLARALGRESHWLRTAPEATAAVLWNRLRRSGWSEHDLSGQLRVPVDTAFLRVRHTATRESLALVRDLVGHSGDVSAYMVTPDGLRVVSASGDKTLEVWDLESGRALASLKGHVETHDMGAVGVQPQVHRTSSRGSSSPVPKVDIGILTIRDDEFRAVLDVFPQKAGAGVHKGANRQYILRHAEVATGERYTVAILRQVEQGTGEAQHAARDLMEDLSPKLVLVVGIAGGLPSDDVTLGDVVLGTRIHDYTVAAIKAGHEATYAATGGPIDQAIAAAVVALAGREDELGDWTSGLPSQPTVAWTEEGQVYGPPEWQRELRAKLEHHYGGGASRRAPIYVSGPIASSDRLVKDPTVLFPWITTARNLLAVEMESGGVYRAARERCPMLAIRGISDIVGLSRADAWTKFACASAAAFARAFLRTQPVPVEASLGAADPQ
jgi:nucleoside phosphorylase